MPRLWARGRTPKKQNNSRTQGVIFHPYGERKNPGLIWTKFCTEGDIRDIITLANFGIDRFRGFSMARGQILGFSIGFRHRPYNIAYVIAVPRSG